MIILLQLLTIIQACSLVQCEQPGCLRLQQVLCDQFCVIVTWAIHIRAEWITLPVNQAIFARYGDQFVGNVTLASDEALHALDALLLLHLSEQPRIIKCHLCKFLSVSFNATNCYTIFNRYSSQAQMRRHSS